MIPLNCHLVAARLRTLIEAAIPEVRVVRTVADAEMRETIWVGTSSRGDLSAQHFGPTVQWADHWAIDVQIATRIPGTSLEDAEARCMAILNAVMGAVCDSPTPSTGGAITAFVALDTTDQAREWLRDGPHLGLLPDSTGFGAGATLTIPFLSISGA